MRELPASKSNGEWLRTAALGAIVFLLNVYICRELLGIEYLRHMESIEGVFIALARFAMAHWKDLTWFPLWADGVPYQTAYPPLLPLLAALCGGIRGLSPAHAYHWVTAFFYCLGPVALFALAFRLSRSRWTAFAAGLIYSSLSTSAWLVPAIAQDLGSPFFARRLQALVYYGEGPHVSSITLLTAALLCLDRAMEQRRAPRVLLAALAFAATALTNWMGAFATVLIVVPYTIAHLGGREGWKWRDAAWVGLIGATAYCLAAPLMPPSTIAVLKLNAVTTGGDYAYAYHAALPNAIGVAAGLVIGKFLVRRLPRYLQFAILFAFLMMLLTLADDWLGLAILPMAARYHLEMELALALLLAFTGHALLRNRPRRAAALSISLLAIAVIQPVRLERRYARNFLLRPGDIRNTIEWQKAQWINRNWTGGRVLIAGSSLFWWAAFSDVPELWGVDQGTTNPIIRVAEYAIYHSDRTGPDHAAIAVLWLKALGVHAVGVSGPASPEKYKLFQNPKVFEGVLAPIWREGDDVIYRVDEAGPSLARVVPRSALARREPVNGLDVEPVRPYVAALDDPHLPRAQFRWTSVHSAAIATHLEPDRVISLQIAWSRGWHADVNGRSVPVQRDAIGLMYLDPGIAGPCEARIFYDGGLEMLLARGVSLATALLLIVLSLRPLVRRTRRRLQTS